VHNNFKTQRCMPKLSDEGYRAGIASNRVL
jgi:hypothetical protein